MYTIDDLTWPPGNAEFTYEDHREKLASLGKLDAATIIKSDDTVSVTITNDNVYTISSKLTIRSIKTTISIDGKIILPGEYPCFGVLEILCDRGDGVIEFNLYDIDTQMSVSESESPRPEGRGFQSMHLCI